MSLKTIEFHAFGVEYRTKQFSAVHGMELLALEREYGPFDLLTQTDVRFAGQWINLIEGDAINEHVRDVLNIVPPLLVLRGIMGVVHEKNFGFIATWKGVKVPRRFVNGAPSMNSAHIDPLIAQLIQDEVATMRELEEYYSLHDAFKMFDVMVAKGINEAYAHEVASKSSRRR
jgi:hypothetical protein